MSSSPDRYGFRTTRIDGVRTVSLIEIETAEGDGTEGDPVRMVQRYFDSTTGDFIAERDTSKPVHSVGMPQQLAAAEVAQ